MPLPDGVPGGPGGTAELTAVHVTVNGTTFLAEYEVKGGAVLLASADFGDASARLDGLEPAAARLLRGLAEGAMASGSADYVRDDEANAPEAPGA